MTYKVFAYDKDNDVKQYLFSSKSIKIAFAEAQKFAQLCETNDLRRTDNNEPFDWVQIEKDTEPDDPIWISNGRTILSRIDI